MPVIAVHRDMRLFGGVQATQVCILCGLIFEPAYSPGCGRLEGGEWVCSGECRAAACYDYRDECAGP
ncbi:MAG TPA: hypothetical protein DD766_08840 [Desulfovibrio sp.]|jgi:hypothetical protein|nr:hypothetical protein [Desulfovibrio sp.]